MLFWEKMRSLCFWVPVLMTHSLSQYDNTVHVTTQQAGPSQMLTRCYRTFSLATQSMVHSHSIRTWTETDNLRSISPSQVYSAGWKSVYPDRHPLDSVVTTSIKKILKNVGSAYEPTVVHPKNILCDMC